jgi:serine/threonine protein kinase
MWKRSISFEIKELLGEGSQGQVYRALRQDPGTGLTQTVAVKILHSETTVESWKDEFQSLAKVRSPYCVQVFGFERLNKRPALVLEYVDGVSLSALGKAFWFDEEDIREILAQCEAAVLDLYKFGAFHGDLSPHNVLIDSQGHLRLLDFGLANCRSGLVRATPEFASPERLCGESATLASDIFSLGRIELFLRGAKPTIDLSSPYLNADPDLRSLRGWPPETERQNNLAIKVKAFQERRALTRDTRTAILVPLRPRRLASMILATISGCLLLTLSSTVQSTGSKSVPVLQIRTHHWHYFRLNGSPLGYSPINLPLEAGRTYHLEWTTANGSGVRSIQVQPGRIQKLSDRDFSH